MNQAPEWPWQLSSEGTASAAHLEEFCRASGLHELLFSCERMGRREKDHVLADGQEIDLPYTLMGLGEILRKRLEADLAAGGMAWYRATVTWRDGVVTVDLDRERPPTDQWRLKLEPSMRTPDAYAYELDMYPRQPHQVPGWMKVELAAVGAWDLVRDIPTWDGKGPNGTPMTPESAGVPAPPGAEYAEPVTLPAAPAKRGLRDRLRGTSTPAAPEPVPAAAPEPEPEPSVAQTAWTEPSEQLPLGPYSDLYRRWITLAERFPGAVVRHTSAAVDSGIGVAPVLRDVAAVFPGVEVGGWTFGWDTDPDAGQPALGNRFTYQPVSWTPDGRFGIVTRINPDGTAGEVLSVDADEPTEDGSPTITTIAPDTQTALTELVTFVEGRLPEAWAAVIADLRETYPDEADDAELIAEQATEVLDQDLHDHFHASAT